MKIVANGCSQTFGAGLSGIGTDPHDWPCDVSSWNEQVAQANRQYALANSWPAQLAKKLGSDYINLAKPGGSNDRIVRTTLQYLTQEKNTQDHLVVIGWTEMSRREVHLINYKTKHHPQLGPDGYKTFLAGDNSYSRSPGWEKWAKKYRRYGWDETESYVRYFQQILLLTAYLKNNNIPHLYFQAVDPEILDYQKVLSSLKEYTRRMTQHLYEAINWNDFVESDDQTNDRMMEIFCSHIDNTGHFTLTGHEQVAKILHSELIKRSII